MTPALVSAAQIAAFDRAGFVVIDGLLSDEELIRFAPLVTAAVHARSHADQRALHERSLYEQSFQQCQNLWEDWPEVRALSFDQRITGMAASLIGARRLRLWHEQCGVLAGELSE